MKDVGTSSRERSQGVPKFFRATMYRAHCAVIFAIVQLSCGEKALVTVRLRGVRAQCWVSYSKIVTSYCY